MTDPLNCLDRGDGLLLVHVQKDFCAGGALPVPHGEDIVPVLNRWIAAARQRDIPVFASRDWHPVGHPSFRENGGQWPPHCVQDSDGAQFHPRLQLPEDVAKVTTGVRFDQDQYSAFEQSGLATLLRRLGVRRLWVGGLAQDVCVMETVLGGLREGFDMGVILEATRPLGEASGRESIQRMRAAGAVILGD